jgi:hypothetical protein
MGMLMILFPRLSEWLFRYNEDSLTVKNDNDIMKIFGEEFYRYKLTKSKTLITENELQCSTMTKIYNYVNPLDETKIEKEIIYDEKLLKRSYRRFKGYLNFKIFTINVLYRIKKNLFLNERRDLLPEEYAPLTKHRIDGQLEKYENRMSQLRQNLYKAIDIMNIFNGISDVYRDRKLEKKNLELFLEGKDLNVDDLIEKCKYI